jgi:hypothetical protein
MTTSAESFARRTSRRSEAPRLLRVNRDASRTPRARQLCPNVIAMVVKGLSDTEGTRLWRHLIVAMTAMGQLRRFERGSGMSASPPIASDLLNRGIDVVGQNRPSRGLSEAPEIRVRFNGELPAGRAHVL